MSAASTKLRLVTDSLVNLVSGLGTVKDKNVFNQYVSTELTQQQLDAAFRSDWVARKAVCIPADDATREWRAWQADEKQIETLEEAERALGLQRKVRSAIRRARLYGGSAIVLGVGSENYEKELNVETVARGDLKYIHVVSRHEVSVGEVVRDVLSPFHGEPAYYQFARPDGNQVRVHPSRVVRLIGAEVLDPMLGQQCWGDSILMAVDDAIKNVGVTSNGVAQLVHEAKIDFIRLPGLMEQVATAEYRARLVERFQLANVTKSVANAVLLDKEEEWERVTTSFAGMPDVLRLYISIAAGAVDIPVTRLLGESARGLNATGEGDLRNHYDRVGADQRNDVGPSLARLDEVLIRSALGARDPNIYYEWNPLWQMDEAQKADVAVKKAQAHKIDVDLGLIDPNVLRDARQNQLVEDGTYPGLEAALEDAGEPEDISERDPQVQEQFGRSKQIAKDYSPDQPREKGGPDGGQWTRAGFGSASGDVTRVKGNFTREERGSVRNYQDISYEDWNRCLRKGNLESCKIKYPGDEEFYAGGLGDLVTAIDKSSITKDAILYRGIEGAGGLDADSLKNSVGKTITIGGFTSTTRVREVMDDFGGKTIFEIYAQKGTKGLSISGHEKEVLLPHNSQFYVQSVLPDLGKKSTVVRVVYLGQKS